MRAFSYLTAAAATLIGSVWAEDLLFVDTLKYTEYQEATTTLGMTAKVVTIDEWKAMTTTDFTKFKAIIISDPNCVDDTTPIKFLEETKNTWSPAVTGNMILIGTDPTYHDGRTGAVTLIQNSIKFAAAGASTGLYFALSCYYNDVDVAPVDALSVFGDFKVRGKLSCYNNVHIVAGSEAMTTLTDASLSDWSCSVHEAFSSYPTAGTGGFQALAIAKDILGVGSQTFADGTMGLPYIISRGAVPTGCGNGVYEPTFLEECDLGSSNGAEGSLCDKSCKCKYGVLDAAAGTCKSKPADPSGTGTGPHYGNSTTTVSVPYPVTVTSPATPIVVIIGIEIVIIIDITLVCPPGSTVTTTVTKTLSTLQRPIYGASTSGHPCYICAIGTPKPDDFVTVINTICPATPIPAPPVTYKMCHSCPEAVISTKVPGAEVTKCGGDCTGFVKETPHIHGTPAPSTPAYTRLATVVPSGSLPVKPTETGKVVVAGAARNAVAYGAAAGVVGVIAALL